MSEVLSVLKYIFVLFCSSAQIFVPYGRMLAAGGISSMYDGWKSTDKYTSDYAFTIEKNPEKDFIILNLTDIQIEYETLYSERNEYTENLVKKLVDEVKPDLITLSGDNSSCDVAYLYWNKLIDSFGIPWAPIMGNHDGNNGNKLNEAWASWLYANKYDNCLFKVGPEDMGYGNYIINITENGEVIHTLFMLDTHSDADDTENGIVNYSADGDHDDDHLWSNQIEWYEWAVNGIAAEAGHTVESTAIMHIPVYQMGIVQKTMVGEDGKLLPEYESLGSGQLGERVCCPKGDNGFFAKAKELGSTTMMIFGHDHKNNMCITYDGIRLNYAQKSGHGSYWDDNVMGGSVITINSSGNAEMNHIDYISD